MADKQATRWWRRMLGAKSSPSSPRTEAQEMPVYHRTNGDFRIPPRQDGTSDAFPARCEVTGRYRLAREISPSSETGPEPITVPCTGFSLVIDLRADTDPIEVSSISAEISGMSAPSFDAILQVSSPDLILHGDFDQEIDPKPLDLPHLEILLDEDPPRLQNASTSPQPELQLPITLSPGNSTKIFAAPMTADQRKLDWDLLINWRSGNITGTTRFQLSATADLGFEILSPHDKPPRKETNIRRAASEHWAPHEPEPDKSISVAVHSASDRAVAEQYYVLRALLTWNIQVPIRNQTFCLGEIDGEGYYLIADSTNSISIPEPGPGSFWTYQLADFIGKAVEYETGLIAGVNFDSGPRLFTLSKAECERLHDDPHTWSVRDTGIPENVGPFRFPTEKRRQFDDIAQDGVDAFIFYLTQAPTILEIGRRVDDLNPDRGAVVECDIHSDGTWIWSESLAYYLREYRIGPSPEMCRHIVDNFETREALHEDQVKLAQTAFIEQQRLIVEHKKAREHQDGSVRQRQAPS